MLRSATPHHHAGAASSMPNGGEMIQQDHIQGEQPEPDEGSMRVIEYVLAIVALATAVILAFVR